MILREHPQQSEENNKQQAEFRHLRQHDSSEKQQPSHKKENIYTNNNSNSKTEFQTLVTLKDSKTGKIMHPKVYYMYQDDPDNNNPHEFLKKQDPDNQAKKSIIAASISLNERGEVTRIHGVDAEVSSYSVMNNQWLRKDQKSHKQEKLKQVKVEIEGEYPTQDLSVQVKPQEHFITTPSQASSIVSRRPIHVNHSSNAMEQVEDDDLSSLFNEFMNRQSSISDYLVDFKEDLANIIPSGMSASVPTLTATETGSFKPTGTQSMMNLQRKTKERTEEISVATTTTTTTSSPVPQSLHSVRPASDYGDSTSPGKQKITDSNEKMTTSTSEKRHPTKNMHNLTVNTDLVRQNVEHSNAILRADIGKSPNMTYHFPLSPLGSDSAQSGSGRLKPTFNNIVSPYRLSSNPNSHHHNSFHQQHHPDTHHSLSSYNYSNPNAPTSPYFSCIKPVHCPSTISPYRQYNSSCKMLSKTSNSSAIAECHNPSTMTTADSHLSSIHYDETQHLLNKAMSSIQSQLLSFNPDKDGPFLSQGDSANAENNKSAKKKLDFGVEFATSKSTEHQQQLTCANT